MNKLKISGILFIIGALGVLIPYIFLGWLGYISSAIYFLAQAELLATVIEGFPVFNLAGFWGSTLWLIWLILVCISLIKYSKKE